MRERRDSGGRTQRGGRRYPSRCRTEQRGRPTDQLELFASSLRMNVRGPWSIEPATGCIPSLMLQVRRTYKNECQSGDGGRREEERQEPFARAAERNDIAVGGVEGVGSA